MASSVDVAAYFDKKHYHVLRDIRRLCEQASAAFTESNFGFSAYKDSTGRSLPHCLMTKNGFVLLVMGFSGPKALEFKLAYIAAFGRLFLSILRFSDYTFPGKSPQKCNFSPTFENLCMFSSEHLFRGGYAHGRDMGKPSRA